MVKVFLFISKKGFVFLPFARHYVHSLSIPPQVDTTVITEIIVNNSLSLRLKAYNPSRSHYEFFIHLSLIIYLFNSSLLQLKV